MIESKLEIPENMADIKPVMEFEKSTPVFLKFIIITVVLGLIICLIFFIIKYFKNRNILPKDNTPFYIDSLKKLEILENKDIDIQEKWFKLSLLFRDYIYKRYEIDALNMGDSELEIKILQFIPEIYINQIQQFLNYCNLHKFSNQISEETNFYEQAEIVREFINVTGTAFEQAKRDA